MLGGRSRIGSASVQMPLPRTAADDQEPVPAPAVTEFVGEERAVEQPAPRAESSAVEGNAAVEGNPAVGGFPTVEEPAAIEVTGGEEPAGGAEPEQPVPDGPQTTAVPRETHTGDEVPDGWPVDPPAAAGS